MVRETRFSFDDDMKVNYPVPEEDFDEEDRDDLVADRRPPLKTPRPSRRERKRNHPGDRRPDRRHLADADWSKRAQPDERAMAERVDAERDAESDAQE